MPDKLLDMLKCCGDSEWVLNETDDLSLVIHDAVPCWEQDELDEVSLLSVTGGSNNVKERIRSRILTCIGQKRF